MARIVTSHIKARQYRFLRKELLVDPVHIDEQFPTSGGAS